MPSSRGMDASQPSSLIFLTLGLVALEWPKVLAFPLGVLAVWFAATGMFQAWRLYHRETTEKMEDKPPVADSATRRPA